jgi:hypothetical protein
MMKPLRVLPAALAMVALSAACSFGVELTGFFGGVAGIGDAGTVRPELPDAAPQLSVVGVTPTSVTTAPGGRVQLAATVSPKRTLTWSVDEGAAGGSVSASGLYVAPYAAGTFHVTVTAEDGAKAQATFTVPPGIALLAGRTDGYVDGPAKDARFRGISRVARDAAGNLYVSDRAAHTIRKITTAGVISTLAGTPDVPGSADGTAMAAQFANPEGICVSATRFVRFPQPGL